MLNYRWLQLLNEKPASKTSAHEGLNMALFCLAASLASPHTARTKNNKGIGGSHLILLK